MSDKEDEQSFEELFDEMAGMYHQLLSKCLYQMKETPMYSYGKPKKKKKKKGKGKGKG